MRLLRLYIDNYRVLRKLDLRFDPLMPQDNPQRNYHLDFLVGVNGTGKSTVLRLLARIFRGVTVSFAELNNLPFVLEYYRETDNKTIYIANIRGNSDGKIEYLERYFVRTIDGLDTTNEYEIEDSDEEHLKDVVEPTLLPERIIAYTTGSEDEWLNQDRFNLLDSQSFQSKTSPEDGIKMTPEERTIQEMPGWNGKQTDEQEGKEERFRFIRQSHLVLVALTGLLMHETDPSSPSSPLQNVLKQINLQGLSGFSLQFNLAYASANERNQIWQRLGQRASRAIRSGGNVLLVFQPDTFANLLEENGGALALFEQLADWYSQELPLLTKVNLFLEHAKSGAPLHTWEWLSDGERSFLGRMCLFMLFGEVESLILLDEPEVHFNDYWKRHIVSTIHQVLKGKNKPHRSHLLIATHSSISLSDVSKEDVVVLQRPDLLTNTMNMPSIQTFGADPSDIMVHVFGAPHAMGEYSVTEVQQWLRDAAQEPQERRRKFLEDKLKQVSPGYWVYRIRREMVGLPQE